MRTTTSRFPVFGVLLVGFLYACASRPAKEEDWAGSESFPLLDIAQVDGTIMVDARYYSESNFTGVQVPGYQAAKCFLSREAASRLAAAQKSLRAMGLSLKVYDCYRPQAAVDYFVAWSKVPDNEKIKAVYYPNERKQELFQRGYIAEKSGHSRGSTVDLSIVPLGTERRSHKLGGKPCFNVDGAFDRDGSLNMGTSFDCFDERSHTANAGISVQSRANRLLLKSVMEQNGFNNYEKEWWHFTLVNEPFHDRYFDVPVR